MAQGFFASSSVDSFSPLCATVLVGETRDRVPVERIDQWGGGIAAAEAQPSGVVGGLAVSRSEGTEPPGYNEQTLRSCSSLLASTRQCGRPTLCCSLPRPRGRLGRSWIAAQLWAGRASAPLPSTRDVEGKLSRARPRGSTSFGGTAEEKVKIRLSKDGHRGFFVP